MNFHRHHMMLSSRRRVLAAIGPAMVLAGCSLSGCQLLSGLTPSQLQTDLTTLSDGLGALWNALSAAGAKLPADVLAKAQSAITALQANAQAIITAIQSGASVSSVASVFSALLSGINALVPIVATFYPPATAIGAAVSAAVVLVQIILQEAGIGTPAPAAAALAPGAADNARSILRNAAAGGLN